MTAFITPADIAPFADIDADKLAAMIDDASAMAAQAAPCINTADFQANAEKMAALKAILRAALLRWNDSGSGAVTQQAAGPFSQSIDTTRERRGMYWPSEITQLQELCSATPSGGAYAIDSRPILPWGHADICALHLGATYCSCGAILTRHEYPLWEGGTITQGIER